MLKWRGKVLKQGVKVLKVLKKTIRTKMSILLFCAPKPNARPAILLLDDAPRSAPQRSAADAFQFGFGRDFRLRPLSVGKRGGQKALGLGKL